MLNFFRQIRQSLLATGAVRKYILYAIGEIALVVIGILIALQINNWNVLRDRKAEMLNIYVSILDEIETDNQRLDEILPDFNWKNKVLRRIILEDISLDEWVKNDSLFSSFFSFYDFDIGKGRFQLLKSKVAYDKETRELNNRITDFYNKYSVDIGVRTHEANMSYHRNIEFWEENTDWFSLAIANSDFNKLGEYAIGNPLFRNKLTWYRIVLGRLEYILREYQSESKKLMTEIRSHLDSQGISDEE